MSTSTPNNSFKLSGIFSRSALSLLTGLFVGIALTSFSVSASAEGANDPAAQNGRSPAYQKRLQAEQEAEDQRDRNHVIQEQNRLEELELKRIRAERAEQRNARAAAAKQQQQQQQQQQAQPTKQ